MLDGQQQRQPESHTQMASTSSQARSMYATDMRRVPPGRIVIADSAGEELGLHDSRAMQTAPYSRGSPGNAGTDGGIRGPERLKDLRKQSWTHQSPQTARQVPRRRLSSPLESNLMNAGRRESIGGAKPVAPSFDPDAPPELKVNVPEHPVLLPYLSIPGKGEAGEEESSTANKPEFNAEDVMQSASIKHQRPGIKVRIITWNQGSSVPKGNLEVLLGRVGEYIPPQEGWDESSDDEDGGKASDAKRRHRGMGVAGQEKTPRKERIPPLPHDDAHPYHVVVIAGQECPWGDGKRIATGVGLAGELGDLGRSKSRAAHLAKDKKEPGARARVAKDGDGAGVAPDEKSLLSAVEGEFPFSDLGKGGSIPTTPLVPPTTPGGAGGAGWGIGGKGWSDMCEDWLCRGPLAQATATKGLAQASRATASAASPSPLATPTDEMSPSISRAPTPNPPVLAVQTDGLSELAGKRQLQPVGSSGGNVVAQDHFYSSPAKRSSLAVPRNIGRSLSFVTKSRETLDTPAVVDEERKEDVDLMSSSPISRPVSPLKQAIDANVRLPSSLHKSPPSKAHHRLGLHIPGLSGAHNVTVQSDGTPLSLGAYELVAKERCYMMYMAVYVWRGCLDRVAKTSQGHVKSGLLAGRVGNKGAVGISLKLGTSRLLFVNAHLAAHEGKVAERVANVEKIKKELKVDTFLPDNDPRNQADDLTAAFDYAFWFGDLNFRVDISRQHADWLLMKKQYSDALAFDQLRKIMKEQPWVFNGFSEAPINFPPTFKYDVLKTIRQKREERAKRHRSGSVWPKVTVDGDDSSNQAAKGASSLDAESIISPLTAVDSSREKLSGQSGVDSGSDRALRESKRGEADDDGSSITSSAWGGSGLSMPGNHSDREENGTSLSGREGGDSAFSMPTSELDPVVLNNTAAAEGHKRYGKAVKAKKRFLDVVHAVKSHSLSEKDEHIPQIVLDARQLKAESDDKAELDQGTSSNDRNVDLVSSSPTRHARSESYSSVAYDRSHAHAPLIRRRSSAGDLTDSGARQSESQSPEMKASSSIAAMVEEYEKQPYDTSAKQRVPSWCDRVLWKSNIKVVDEDKRDAPSGLAETNHAFHSRVGTAISHALGSSRRSQQQQTKRDSSPGVTFALMQGSPLREEKTIGSPPHELPSPPLEVVPESANPLMKLRWFNKKGSNQQMRRSTTVDPNDLNKLMGPEKAGKRTMSAVDLPSLVNRADLRQKPKTEATEMPAIRPRRSSLDVSRRRVHSGPAHLRERELLQEYARRVSTSQSAASPSHQPASPSHQQTSQSIQHVALPSPQQVSSPPPLSLSAGKGSAASDAVQRRTSWWSDHVGVHLPSFLNPQGAMTALSNLSSRNEASNGEADQQPMLIGPTRGQIECLLYKSLDDREMRLLEGRSDHRPVVWVGNVGI